MYLRNVDAFLLFLDMTARESFEEMQSWLQIIEEYPPKRGVLLIGTKSDLAHERQISTEEARQFAADRGFRYAEVSSLTGDGVEEAIAQMHSMFPAVELRLLWRGSRDGFSGEAFHRCCDGRDRTVTLVRDTQGNVFGGFAVPAWESPFFSKRKGDLSSESFLFTLKNPHDLPPQRFQLIKGQESSAIRVSSRTCSCFGDDDLFICGDCDRSPSHSRGFGSTYENTTEIDGRFVFTGSDTFIVQEIEVLEVVKGPCIL
jgi:hypothetical protein